MKVPKFARMTDLDLGEIRNPPQVYILKKRLSGSFTISGHVVMKLHYHILGMRLQNYILGC